MKPQDELSSQERLKRFYERLESGEFNRKPTVAVVTVPVSNKVAQVVRANPESVRISARDGDRVSVFEKPQHNSARVTVMVDYIREIDAQGRPVWPSVVHEYDPLSRL